MIHWLRAHPWTTAGVVYLLSVIACAVVICWDTSTEHKEPV